MKVTCLYLRLAYHNKNENFVIMKLKQVFYLDYSSNIIIISSVCVYDC